ncbi:hypothetical protein AU467_21290 [Mesorhizobium loti]|uniref:Uncharacterized protein n=1 Tax=Rhizobium loti TaxID=381 RepID=A0A101KTD8_RHILI|nr:hypothetical protein AU467_21290 [Mesorhizobium loti]
MAISTICCCASDSDATGASAEKLAPTRFNNGATISRSLARSTSLSSPAFSGSRPKKMLAATSRFSNRLSSWCTKAMPEPMLASTVSPSCATPSTVTVPLSGRVTPPRIFISVDLPAPFSPTRPITSPGLTSMENPSSATTPG